MSLEMTDAGPWHVTSADIERHIDYLVAIEAARKAAIAHASGSVVTARTSLAIHDGWMRLMAASLPSLGVFGYKEFHLTAGGAVRYCIHLFEIETGRPVGVVDAALVTTLRTAATAAIAVQQLAGATGPVKLGVIGTGAEAEAGVLALNTVLDLGEVTATSRQAANREAFVRTIEAKAGIAVKAVADLSDAIADVDVAYVATNSGGAVVLPADAAAKVPLVASIGSTLPAQRELAGAVLRDADHVIVDTMDVLHESGDAIEARAIGWSGEQAQLLGAAVEAGFQARPGDRTVYKSIGSPEQDIVLALAIVEHAKLDGFGRAIEPLSAVKVNL